MFLGLISDQCRSSILYERRKTMQRILELQGLLDNATAENILIGGGALLAAEGGGFGEDSGLSLLLC